MLLKKLVNDQYNAMSAVCYELEKRYPGISEFIDDMIKNNETVLDLQLFLITDTIYDELTFDLNFILENDEKFINLWKNKQGSLRAQLTNVLPELRTHSLKKPIKFVWKFVKLKCKIGSLKCKIVNLKNKIWKS